MSAPRSIAPAPRSISSPAARTLVSLQDLEKGKPLELDVLLAAVVELAALTRTPVPKLCAVHALADLLATTTTATASPGTIAA
jgi:hypothetical protein